MQKNEWDVLVSGIYMLVVENTMFHHLCGNWMFTKLIHNFQHKSFNSNEQLFRSFDMLIPRISLFSGSIVATHHIQMYSDPTLIAVSSFCIQEYSEIFSFSY
jgi:hypothetical protein